MLADITVKDYYLQFIYQSRIDTIEYRNLLNEVLENKSECYNYINENKDIIKEQFNIDLNNYIEFTNKEYNSGEALYQICVKMLSALTEHPNRICIIQLIKYCNLLRNEHKYNRMIYLTTQRKNLKFSEYKKYVMAYYCKVHKCVLQGFGYKFNYGIGTYIINRWKLPEYVNTNKILDYAATNERKKELQRQGIKLYDEKEAQWYAMRHIPYDGVDYRVYQENRCWYEFTFINSKVFGEKLLEYQRTEYVVNKLRGMSYTQMAQDLCKNEEDIYNLQIDIKYKLNILLYKYPNKYINFVRNAEEDRYKHRAANSKNR